MKKRKIIKKLKDALSDTPVILIHGARQTGKSTLIKEAINSFHQAVYVTLDDFTVLSAVKENPNGFLSSFEGNIVLDEVQKAPELFPAIKKIVDEKRKPGQFILSGSSNVLFLPALSESLAGRMEILNLYPFSQNEISENDFDLLDAIFLKHFKAVDLNKKEFNNYEKFLSGGFPEVQTRISGERKDAWFRSYITTILQKDIRELANIEKINDMPKLLQLFATRAGTLTNYAELSRSSGLPQTTLKRYIYLLEATFLIINIPAWSANLSKRLIKTPKLFLTDTGLLSHLVSFTKDKILSDSGLWGRIIENFVLMELMKQITWSNFNINIYHFRTTSGQEVDFILERNNGDIVAVEVKSSAKVEAADFKHIKVVEEEIGNKFLRGIVFYTGNQIVPFAKNLFAVPISMFN